MGARVVVAFSGGPDSLALLAGLKTLAPRLSIELWAVHVDHGLDDGSAERLKMAQRLAQEIDVGWLSHRCSVGEERWPGESLEAAARRIRYRALEQSRSELGAVAIATAHQLDDQAETVLLRLRQGSGWRGVAGIQPIRGRVVRPVLNVPRRVLADALQSWNLQPLDDPTNHLPVAERNRLRQTLLPALVAAEPALTGRLARVAEQILNLVPRVDERLLAELNARRLGNGVAVSLQALARLPTSLRSTALAAIHRHAGAPYPAAERAGLELARQLIAGRAGCDCGHGFRWQSLGREELWLHRPAGETTAPFSYTFAAPGQIDLPELATTVKLSPGPVEAWMFRPWSHRAGLKLPIRAGKTIEVRSRRAGDRLQPFGHRGQSRLKCLLIDRKVPRWERDRLPLLVVDGNIAWVPGVTVDNRFRVEPGGEAWIAEIIPWSEPRVEEGRWGI